MKAPDPQTTTYPYLNDIVSDLAYEICRLPCALGTQKENIEQLLIKFADEVRRSAREP